MVKNEDEFKGYFMTGLKLWVLNMIVSIVNIFVVLLAFVLIIPSTVLGVFGYLFAFIVIIATFIASIALSGWLAKRLWNWD